MTTEVGGATLGAMKKWYIALGVAALVVLFVNIIVLTMSSMHVRSGAWGESEFIENVSRPGFALNHADYVEAVEWCGHPDEWTSASNEIWRRISRVSAWEQNQKEIAYNAYLNGMKNVC